MKTFLKNSAYLFVTVFIALSCSDDDNVQSDMSAETYNTTFKITDAPIDNADVEAVFVTIADVKVDGQSLEGFSKTTLELSALVNGQTETLGNLDLQAGTYSSLELILDYESDQTGSSPGCYVALADGTKDKIESTSGTITINDAFEVFATNTNEVVIDFDLRKTIREEESTLSSNFDFVTISEISAGIRTVNEETTGKISGNVNDSENTSDKIVVYAYEKGTFNAEAETSGQGESNIQFANAVTSSAVTGINNSYSLNFLKEGEYELIFVSYTQGENANLEFNALLEAESSTGLNLGAISVTSAIQLDAHVTIVGTK